MTDASKEIVQGFLNQVFAAMFDPSVGADQVGQFFSDDYRQTVDGKTMDLSEFKRHVQAVKNSIASASVTFEHLLVEGSRVADLHIIHGTRKDASPFRIQVMAFYQIENGKIRRIEELTHLLEGSPRDRDLGSRTEPD